jgi:uncharacterized protein (TIGR00255 family)
MTGFARAEAENDAYSVDVEMRSVNYRYLDVRARVPSSLSSLEAKIRDLVGTRFSRGKVDVTIRLRPKAESAYELEVDKPLIHELVRTARSLGDELGAGGEVTLSDLLGFSRAFNVKEKVLSDASQVWGAVQPVIEEALSELDRMRQAEGSELEADLTGRVEAISKLLGAIEEISASSRDRRRRELLEKIQELEATSLEPSILAMEVARLVERSDIAEEITRFRSHLTLWKEAATSKGACGKKLDFILQEMNREVNTVGSKCQDAAIAEHVIEIKSELERMREQVQNIE